MNLLLTNVSREAGLGMGARNAELNSINKNANICGKMHCKISATVAST